MELANPLYPMRAVIRCKARQYVLLEMSDHNDTPASLDERLLNDLAATLFQSEQGQVIFTPYSSREAVDTVENDLAKEIATTYQQIIEQRQDPVVQNLNALLEP